MTTTVTSMPMSDPGRAIYFDLRVYAAGPRHTRNLLVARNAVTPSANFIAEQTLVLQPALSSGSSHTLQGTTGNTLTIVTASAPVSLRVTRDTGVLDMGLHTTFIFTASILSLQIENTGAEAVSVEVIHA